MPVQSPLMTLMTRAAEKAAKSLLRDFGEVEQLQVSVKGPADFVSAADRRAEKILFEELSKARPGASFLMEESGAVGPADAEYRWIIDPLDGTTNFLHGLPHWSISIGLERKGEMVAALILDPVKNEAFNAEQGRGAFMNNRRLRVSGRKDLALAVVSGGYHPKKDPSGTFYKTLEKIMDQTGGYRPFGSAALDLAYVAAGRLEGIWDYGLGPWDVAAGALIVAEAGGKMVSLSGDSNLLYADGILAATPTLLGPLEGLLRGA